MSDKRTFTIVGVQSADGRTIKKEGGRFVSSTPAGAARKAFTQCARDMKKKKVCLHVHIQETSRGCDKKVFKYCVTRIHDPVEVKRGKESVMYQYRTEVKSLNGTRKRKSPSKKVKRSKSPSKKVKRSKSPAKKVKRSKSPSKRC